MTLETGAPLSSYTRFAIGGPAAIVADVRSPSQLAEARAIIGDARVPWVMLGEGSNVIAADSGYRGVVLRFTGSRIVRSGPVVEVEAGTPLQRLVDYSISQGLSGIHTMTGIPGWVGAAVYGNAGAYGRSMHESVTEVRFFDGTTIRAIDNAECSFRYRESIFKKHKTWTILGASLALNHGGKDELAKQAAEIRAVRDAKYPPTMRCAGSIFKNCILSELPAPVAGVVPAHLIREGKVPSAWFLEQVGAKGMRLGGIQVASYHANLIYNDGGGTASEARQVIGSLKQRVLDRFGLALEEEVQYLGFE